MKEANKRHSEPEKLNAKGPVIWEPTSEVPDDAELGWNLKTAQNWGEWQGRW